MITDWLAAARAAVRARTNAGNVYVLPAGAFADFRLDGPQGVEIAFDRGGMFDSFKRNECTYVRMNESWYDHVSRELNGLPSPDLQATSDFDLYLCLRIVRDVFLEDPIDRRDIAILRAAMELPRLAGSSSDGHKMAISGLVRRIRARNAVALREGGGRGGIRAACAMIIAFGGHAQDASVVF